MKPSTQPTPQRRQRQARGILLRLPLEIIFQFWGIVLQSEDSYRDFNTILSVVPELARYVQVATDNVTSCSSLFNAGAPRILSLSDHELEMKRQWHAGHLIRRVLMLFECDKAVETGELTAYEMCRYGRLALSPLIDASYCLLTAHEGCRNYTEDLLFRLRTTGRRAHVKLDFVYDERTSAFPEPPITDGCERSHRMRTEHDHETTAVLRSRADGTISDYRVSISEKCIQVGEEDEVPFPGTNAPCSNPVLALGVLCALPLPPQIHILFRGTRVPLFGDTGSVAKLLENLGASRQEFAANNYMSTFAVANLSWSFTTPQGRAPCQHALTRGVVDQDRYNSFEALCSGTMSFSNIYRRIWYYGLPFSTVAATMYGSTPSLQEFVWFRLSPTSYLYDAGVPSREPERKRKNAPNLKRLSLFSELRTQFHDYRSIPQFSGHEHMDCVQLVALAKSDMAWDVGLILSEHRLESLELLELLQLRDPSEPSHANQFVSLDWKHIALATDVVHRLIIGGYIPAFALPESTLYDHARVFCHLVLMSLDVSPLITSATSTLEDHWYKICLPESHFPCLSNLYLKGVMDMPSNWYPKISLTKTCTILGLSSVIRTKAMVNDQLLEIPNIAVVADTLQEWKRSGEGEFELHGGRRYDGFTKRIEEIDEALRPI